jgi:hypothetical protein
MRGYLIIFIEVKCKKKSHAGPVFAVVGCYTAHAGSFLPMLWDELFVPSSRIKQPSLDLSRWD